MRKGVHPNPFRSSGKRRNTRSVRGNAPTLEKAFKPLYGDEPDALPSEETSSRLLQAEMQQTEVLIDMEHALKRIGRMGEEMGEEMTQQNELLQELDDDLEETGNRIELMDRKLQAIMSKHKYCSYCRIIGTLLLVLILLLFIIIYL